MEAGLREDGSGIEGGWKQDGGTMEAGLREDGSRTEVGWKQN